MFEKSQDDPCGIWSEASATFAHAVAKFDGLSGQNAGSRRQSRRYRLAFCWAERAPLLPSPLRNPVYEIAPSIQINREALEKDPELAETFEKFHGPSVNHDSTDSE